MEELYVELDTHRINGSWQADSQRKIMPIEEEEEEKRFH